MTADPCQMTAAYFALFVMILYVVTALAKRLR